MFAENCVGKSQTFRNGLNLNEASLRFRPRVAKKKV